MSFRSSQNAFIFPTEQIFFFVGAPYFPHRNADRQVTDVVEQAQHEGVDILAVPLGGGTGPYPDAYSVTLKVKEEK